MWTTFNLIVYCLLLQFFGENNGLIQSSDILISKDRRLKGIRNIGNKIGLSRNTMDFSDVRKLPGQKNYFAAIVLENLPKLVDPAFDETIQQSRDLYTSYVDDNEDTVDMAFSKDNQNSLREGIPHVSNLRSKNTDHDRNKRYRSAVSDRIAHGFGKRDHEQYQKNVDNMERKEVIVTLRDMIKQLTYKGDVESFSNFLDSSSYHSNVGNDMKQSYSDDRSSVYGSYPIAGLMSDDTH